MDSSLNSACRLAFNRKGEEQEEFRALLMDITKIASGLSICDLYPSVKILQSITGMKRKLQNLVKRCDMVLDPIVDHHIRNKRDDDDDHKDLMDVLLTFHKGHSEFSLPIENIKAIAMELFGAGSETSSTTTEWAMSELLKSPTIMKKAQDEVRQVLKSQGKETVDETSLNDLKYLKHVIKETLRLHPPAPFLVPRESIEQCEVLGHEIPPKTRILINAWMVGRDPKYWTTPESFYPKRFEDSSVDYKGNHFELIPFGAGRRMCPGMGLGMANIELPLATLLYHFDWKLPNGIESQDLNMDESFGITARRKHDLLLIPTVVHPCS